jgi:two-component system, chemotaxis family, response regulator Rcp1
MESHQSRSIWIIANTADQANLIQTVLQQRSAQYQIQIQTLAAALDNCQRLQSGGQPGTSLPDLILLELAEFEPQGEQLLGCIKQNPQLRRIPIVVLAQSDRNADILKSYSLQGNAYVIKGSVIKGSVIQDLEAGLAETELTRLVQRIESFWLQIVTLPPAS